MSRTVDERVVSMQFDNRQFERNVHTTMSTLDKFKTSLNFDGATKGLENIDAASRKINFNPLGAGVEAVQAKFSALQVMGVTALANITNSAVNAGKRITAALTIDPVKMGFSEYETQINAVQTILANTQSKGTTLDNVNSALDELNTYADKTIYNFTEMTRNIGTFTAAGVDLDKSVSSIKGIANLAAVSGSTSQQASTAMYQLSQALAAGKVQLMDWNSVVNAGMGGQLFQDALKRTAKHKGTDVDALIKKYGSFRESLTKGEWLTSDILTETLTQLSGAYSEADLLAQGYSKQQAKEIYELSQTAVNAATKVKTFTQLIDTLKEALQSGWTQTWEILIGDFEKAKELWTSVSDTFGEMINKSSEARNALLTGWADGGGREMAIESIKNAFNGLMSVVKPIKEAFGEIFPPMTAQQLLKFTENVKKLSEKFVISDETSDRLKRTFKGLFAVLDIGKQALFGVFKLFAPLLGVTGDLSGSILGITAGFGDWLVQLNETIKKSSVLDVAIEKIKMGFEKVGEFLMPVVEGVKEFGSTVSDVFSEVADKAELRFKPLASLGESIKGIFVGAAAIIKKLAPGFFAIASGIGNAFGGLMDHITETIANADYDKLFDIFNGGVFAAIALAIRNFISSGGNLLGSAGGFIDNIKDILSGVGDALGAFSQSLKAKTLFTIASAIAILAASLVAMSLIDSDKLAMALGTISTLFVELMATMQIFITMTNGKKLAGVMVVTKAISSLAKSLLILAVALKIMGSMSLEEMGVGLLGITVGLASLVLAVRSLPEAKILKSAKALKTLSTSMIILAVALKIMGSMSLEEMGIGLLGMCTSLAALVLAVRSLPEAKILKSAKALKTLSISLVILAAALKIMGSMSLEEMGIGLLGMSVGLAAMVLAVRSLPKDTALKSAGMLGLATALVVLGGALKIMGSMSMEEMGKGLRTLGVSLAIIVIALNNMNKALPGAAAMIVVAGALAVLAPVLMLMGTMSWESIVKGLLLIAGVFAVFGVAALILKPLVPTIAALAGSLALLGIACTGIGVGIILIATGLTAIAVSGAAISTSLVLIVSSLVGLIPYIIEQIGIGILALCRVISGGGDAICEAMTVVILALMEALVKSVPVIVDGIFVILDSVFESLNKYMPGIVNALFDFLIALINTVAERMPELIKAGVNLLMQFFSGIIDALQGIDTEILVKGILGVGLVAALMFALSSLAGLVPGAIAGVLGAAAIIAEIALLLTAAGVIAQIPGLEWLIGEGGNLLQAVGKALGQFVGGIAAGFSSAMSESLPQIGLALSQFMVNAMPFIMGCKLVDESVVVGAGVLAGSILALTVAELINGIASFLKGGSSFAALGTDLSNFMTNATPFISGASKLNADMMQGVKSLAEVILILTAADVINGLTSWFTGGSGITKFGEQLPLLGTYISGFADNLGSFDESKVTVVSGAADAIKAMAEAAKTIPNEGGLWSALCGENSLAAFGEDLESLGGTLSSFVTSLGTFDETKVTTVKFAAEAVKAMAEVAKGIPNEGGLWGALCGENSLAAFGEDLKSLGGTLSSFVSNLGTFDETKVTSVKCAAEAVKAMADAADYIPNTGGLWGLLCGENSLAAFGEDLKSLGGALSGFITNIGTFDESKLAIVQNASTAVKSLADLSKHISDQGSAWDKLFGDKSLTTFSSQLPTLGTNLSAFVNSAGNVNSTYVKNTTKNIASIVSLTGIDFSAANIQIGHFNTAITNLASSVSSFATSMGRIAWSTVDNSITKIKKLVEMSQTLKDADISALNSFGTALKVFAEKIVDDFVEAISNSSVNTDVLNAAKEMISNFVDGVKSQSTTVKNTFTTIANDAVGGLESEDIYYGFYNAGSYLVEGFALGISENDYKAAAKAAAMAAAAKEAAEEELDINSPSKVGYGIGDFFGQGFVLALNDYSDKSYKSGYGVAEKAREGLSMAINKVNDLINGNMAAQPTIRPVLDLSSVESGVGAINGMFGSGASIGVRANIGAISSTMNRRIQNGANGDVVSAIDKLDKHLGNVGNTSYNFGNITYDDGSNIAEAVQTLVRAAKIERRK